MLQQLAKYAESVGIVSEPGFATKKVHWAVNVSAQGKFLGLEDLRIGKNGKEFPGCPNLLQPELLGGGADQPRSHYLVESAELLLEYSKKEETEPNKIERRRKKRQYFLNLLELSSSSVEQLSWLAGAPLFLHAPSETQLARAELIALKGAPTDSVVVVVESRNPLDTHDWQDWWRAFRSSIAKGAGAETKKASASAGLARDLLTGELVEPIPTHPKIKGLAGIGGLGTGDALISFDKTAFQSYGLEQSRNAPLSAESASCYVAALDHLIGRGQQLADTKICYWYSAPAEDDLFAILLDPDANAGGDSTDVNSLVRAIRSGSGAAKVVDRFYYMSVSGCSGRVMVRDWCEGSFERLQRAVSAWFTDLSIVHRDGKTMAPPPKFWTVLASLFRDPKKEIPSPLAQDLFRRAVNVSPLPANILALAINRIRSDLVTPPLPPFNHARMGLIKAYLNRKNGEQFVQTHLREDHPEPAYHCGRLLAVLAQLQQAAIPEVQAGVVQRFYSSTSQTPALTMGRLLANAQNHLAKISGGLAHYYNGAISGVLTQIDSGFPQTLTLEKQSLFALGYYQQMAEIQRQRAEKRAQKQNKTTRDDEGEFTDEPY